MCQILFKPKGVRMPEGMLEKAKLLNPNGVGCASCNDRSLVVVLNAPLLSNEDMTELWHFRYSLSGVGDADSTQPFRSWHGYFAFAHVGVLKDWSATGKQSDSYLFWKELGSFVQDSFIFPGNSRLLTAYCNMTQNRMVLLRSNGRYIIFGEQNGFWQDGLWLSGVLE
jgi:hypothetical protein